jgi:hypothetical protein
VHDLAEGDAVLHVRFDLFAPFVRAVPRRSFPGEDRIARELAHPQQAALHAERAVGLVEHGVRFEVAPALGGKARLFETGLAVFRRSERQFDFDFLITL